MTISACWLRRSIAICLAIMLAVPFADAAAEPQQTPQSQQAQDTSSAQPQSSDGGPGKPAVTTPQPGASSDPDAATLSQTANGARQAGTPQIAPEQQQNTTQPVGTAAAPYEKPAGAAVSRPAGAAIAPGKQKRRRSFLIKVGLVVGAAVAVGTVVALSKASPSRPN